MPQQRNQRQQRQQQPTAGAQGAPATGGKQRMAGEVWRNYDATSNGGASFDGKDLKHLVKEGWAYNDIYKAAAASGRVNANANRQLSLLGTADSKYSPFKKDGAVPHDVMWDAVGSKFLSQEGYNGDSLKQDIRFLGGDPSKKKNYVVGYQEDEKGRRAEGYYGSLGGDDTMVWRRPGSAFQDEQGKQQDVLRWGGVDADGRALGLSGVRIKGDDSKFNRQNMSTSWSLPKDFIAERDAAAFGKQMDAYKAANPEPAAQPTTPAAKPASFDPSAFRGQIDGLMAAVNGLKGGGSSGSESSGASSPSGGSNDSGTTVQPVAPVAPVGSGGDFLGGFESIINKRYGRPNSWSGDVWST